MLLLFTTESGFDFKHLIGRGGGNVLRCVWASLPGDVSRLWEAGSPARTAWRGLGSSVSPLRVTFLSRLQQLVRSPAVPDYESPLGPPLALGKGRTFYSGVVPHSAQTCHADIDSAPTLSQPGCPGIHLLLGPLHLLRGGPPHALLGLGSDDLPRNTWL